MPYLGKCALIENLNETTVFESNMMRIVIDQTQIDPEYLTYYLTSIIGRKELTKNAKQAVNQASINQTDVGNAMIPIPASLQCQRDVVSIIKLQFSLYDNIEVNIDMNLGRVNAMRQSILKQAFEGKLV